MAEFEDIFGTELYSVLFHYNQHKMTWFCFGSSKKADYFNGTTDEVGEGSSTAESFLDYMNKYQPDKIEKYKGETL